MVNINKKSSSGSEVKLGSSLLLFDMCPGLSRTKFLVSFSLKHLLDIRPPRVSLLKAWNTDQFCFSMCLKGQDFRGVLDWGLVKGCSPRGWVGTAQISQGTGHSTTPDRVPETFGQCSQVNSGICGVSCAGRKARLWWSLWVHSIPLLLFYYSAIPRERPFLKI